jgi:hypothetical protein
MSIQGSGRASTVALPRTHTSHPGASLHTLLSPLRCFYLSLCSSHAYFCLLLVTPRSSEQPSQLEQLRVHHLQVAVTAIYFLCVPTVMTYTM